MSDKRTTVLVDALRTSERASREPEQTIKVDVDTGGAHVVIAVGIVAWLLWWIAERVVFVWCLQSTGDMQLCADVVDIAAEDLDGSDEP